CAGWRRDRWWQQTGLPWVPPSPNMPTVETALIYPGMCLVEATTLSEGRGTTRPLELLGAPDIDARLMIRSMHALAPEWLAGCRVRECWFEPTFHKHSGLLCNGVQIHVDDPAYRHDGFRPWRLLALAFKALRRLQPDYPLWRDFPYEYEHDRLAIDVINGSPMLREWVDDDHAEPGDLDVLARQDEQEWNLERQDFLLYPD
ncbi:MAG: exo-beta-N-acetylmuramidase NamZ domain-containing protein, partial [Gammaproteobacteria bacterium]